MRGTESVAIDRRSSLRNLHRVRPPPARGASASMSPIQHHANTARCMALVWGVHSALIDHDVADDTDGGCRSLPDRQDEGFAEAGDHIAIASACRLSSWHLLHVVEIPE